MLASKSFEPFAQGLRNLGYIEGQNIFFERRSSNGNDEILPMLATELVNLRPDVILSVGTPATRAVKRATPTIPVVFTRIADPVGLDLVHSLARPGGNLAGVSLETRDLAPKWLELLVLAVPGAKRVGVLWDPNFPADVPQLKAVEDAARSLNREPFPVGVSVADDFDPALQAIVGKGAGALIVLPSPIVAARSQRIADFTAEAGLPTMFYRREFVDAGGLMSYGTNFPDMYRRAAVYVDKILRGAKPTDLPVEQPTKFELVINLKTAKALGLTIPLTVLARADQVIE